MGRRARRGSRVLLRLARIPEPQCLRDGGHGPSTPRRPRGRHRGWLWSASKTSRWAGGPAGSQHRGRGGGGCHCGKGARPRGEQGRQTPSPTIKRMEERGPRRHSSLLLALPPCSAWKGGEVLMDPSPPTGSLPPSFVTATSARGAVRPPPLPSPDRSPRPRRRPHSPSGRLIRGASARVSGGGGRSSSSSSSAPRGAGGRLPRPIAAPDSDGGLRAPAQVAQLDSRAAAPPRSRSAGPRLRTWGWEAGSRGLQRAGPAAQLGRSSPASGEGGAEGGSWAVRPASPCSTPCPTRPFPLPPSRFPGAGGTRGARSVHPAWGAHGGGQARDQ